MKQSTSAQRHAVHFCKEWLHVYFSGNLNDFWEVSEFLDEYLEEAKEMAEEITCEYETYLIEKLIE